MIPVRIKRQESQQLTRQRLLAAAGEVFSRRGFYAATLDQVAETAGFSKGAVYSNFASKEELFLALLDERITGESATLQSSRDGQNGDFVDLLLPGAFANNLPAQRDWNLLSIEFFLYAMREEGARHKLAARYRLARANLEEQLERYCAANQPIMPMPAAKLSWLILALGNGLALQSYLEPEALPGALYEETLGQFLSLEARQLKIEGKKTKAAGKKHKAAKKHKARKKEEGRNDLAPSGRESPV